MTFKVLKTLLLSSFALLLTAACTDRGGVLGVRSTPNEFQTYSGAPLVVPEATDKLPEPSLGAKDPHQSSPQEEAKAALQ